VTKSNSEVPKETLEVTKPIQKVPNKTFKNKQLKIKLAN
jgi:hypothetical protein